MKWGKKKASSSSSSRSSLISHVLPASWLTKFKQMSMNSGQEHAKAKPMSGKWNSVPKTPSNCGNGGGGGIGRFYGGDDAFWRLSFGEDGLDGKKKKKKKKNGYNSDNEAPAFPPSNCQSCRSNAGLDFNSMVSEVRKIRGGLSREVEILPEMDTNVREKVAEIRTPRLMRVEKGKKLRKTNQKVVAKNVFEQEKERRIGMDEREDCKLTAEVSDTEFTADQEENCGICAENLRAEWQKLKEMKMEEIKSRGKKQQRKSLYISRELQRRKPKHHSSKVRLYSSPRTPSKVEICRIKAIEDMKKAKIKMRKEKEKMMSMEGFEGLESFAVVKCSFDPQQDFRDSMVEMIKEKKISEPDELEELLACYLTLNSDTYHDLIIKVFRQVWFDMNQACFDAELEHELSYYD